jgi:hypothetical protein
MLHEIDTGNEKPIKLHLHRVPLKQKDVIEDELKKMLQENIIEPSDSPWSSNICLVTKKDGSLRFCIDFGELNHVTHKDAYPLPQVFLLSHSLLIQHREHIIQINIQK